ncbi:ATP-binding protein (plasmid) [Lactobacillus sp. ESL0731]|uniref:VirB4 family type IV secretion system protein n=1 Tax=unclassified Lactobacillus TaxID=2620435 RepID=UPI0023F93639|nr:MULTISPECIES: ATP-binding protein [unclassified Lactobacillus]WEV52103.1 ATP-binding protein [Lactobacillus sp. ESL0700]WEV63264.1 ATP-binding protein [Lactobacillus sp. ESL0731]
MKVIDKFKIFGRKAFYSERSNHLGKDNRKQLFSASDEQRLKAKGYDLNFIAAYQPQGGVRFYDKYAATGNCYFTYLTIIDYRKDPNLLWLYQIFGNDFTQVKFDVHTEEPDKVKSQLNRSITEKQEQAGKGRYQTDMDTADQEQLDLRELAKQFNSGAEIPKSIRIQIKVYAPTLPKLEERMSEIARELKGDGYTGVVFQFTLPEQYKSWYQDYSGQKLSLVAPTATTLGAAVIGGGVPFQGEELIDDHGTLIGHTSTNGPFIFDRFAHTPERTSYNTLVLGQMGSGKSTFLKMNEKSDYDRGYYVRLIDKAGEYTKLVKSQGGVVIKLDGSEGMINPMQVLATATSETDQTKVDEMASFRQHVAKLLVLFSNVMNNQLDESTKQEFSSLLQHFYVDCGLLPADWQKRPESIHITGLKPEEYPVLSNFRDYVTRITTPEFLDKIHATAKRRNTYEQIIIALNNMIENYANLFDGISSLRDLNHTQIVSFDTSTLSKMDQNIYHAQLFSTLNLIQNQAVINGRQQVNVPDIDRQYFSIYFDECHNIINPNNMIAVNEIVNMAREFRKYYAGITLATQDLGAMLPDNVSSADLETLKSIVLFCQYKATFRHEAGQLEKLNKLLGSTLSEADYEQIPKQEQGKTIITIGTTKRYHVQVEPTQQELELFTGGR